jgi:hypothetical protein
VWKFEFRKKKRKRGIGEGLDFCFFFSFLSLLVFFSSLFYSYYHRVYVDGGGTIFFVCLYFHRGGFT